MAGERPDILLSHPGNPRVYDMVSVLVREGFRVRFATGFYHRAGGVFALAARLIPRAERTLRRRNHPGIPPEIVSSSLMGEAIKKGLGSIALSNAWFDRRAARLVRRLRPRAVVAADSTALVTFRAAREVGAVRILDQVTGFSGAARRILAEEAARHPELKDTIHLPRLDIIERCRHEALAADRVLVPSPFVRDTLIEIGVAPDRIALVPYGVDIERFKPAARAADGRFRVLYVGRIGAPKGVHHLLEAFRQAATKDWELVLVGQVMGNRRWLEPWRGIFRQVDFVPHHEVHALYRDADIFVLPSLHEGSALSVYEAMASGLPVVVTPNAGSVARDGVDGYVVAARDVAALAEAMRRLYIDPAMRQRMGASARARAEEHDLAGYGRRLSHAIREALADGGRSAAT